MWLAACPTPTCVLLPPRAIKSNLLNNDWLLFGKASHHKLCVSECVFVFSKPATACEQCHSLCVCAMHARTVCTICHASCCAWACACLQFSHFWLTLCESLIWWDAIEICIVVIERIHLFLSICNCACKRIFLKFDASAYQHVTTRNSYFIYSF